ncbi:hypothetical protein BH09VER1_BH09VER1_23330 [soil metagenome]
MPFTLAIGNRQRAVRFHLPTVRAIALRACAACLASLRFPDSPLASLTEVDATIVSDRQIARVHGQFFGDPTPTDVITFQHGEILIGAETVAENAVRYAHTPDDEAALCVIHGMLHLAGWDDLSARDAKQMAKLQEQIFKTARKMID